MAHIRLIIIKCSKTARWSEPKIQSFFRTAKNEPHLFEYNKNISGGGLNRGGMKRKYFSTRWDTKPQIIMYVKNLSNFKYFKWKFLYTYIPTYANVIIFGEILIYLISITFISFRRICQHHCLCLNPYTSLTIAYGKMTKWIFLKPWSVSSARFIYHVNNKTIFGVLPPRLAEITLIPITIPGAPFC